MVAHGHAPQSCRYDKASVGAKAAVAACPHQAVFPTWPSWSPGCWPATIGLPAVRARLLERAGELPAAAAAYREAARLTAGLPEHRFLGQGRHAAATRPGIRAGVNDPELDRPAQDGVVYVTIRSPTTAAPILR